MIEKAVEGYETFYESQDVAITADELWKANPDANTADNVKKWTVTVTNTHKKSTLAEGSIKVSKSISGREWKNGDSFNFTIAGTDSTPNAPLPDPASVAIGTNTANHEASFGKIVYKPNRRTHERPVSAGVSATDGRADMGLLLIFIHRCFVLSYECF